MRLLIMIFAIFIGAVCGCNSAELPPMRGVVGDAEEDQLTVIRPGPGASFKPGDPIECKLRLMVSKTHQSIPGRTPTVMLLQGGASRRQMRSEPEGASDGEDLTFKAELKAPDRPGRYAIQATTVVAETAAGKRLSEQEQVMVRSASIPIEVKAQ